MNNINPANNNTTPQTYKQFQSKQSKKKRENKTFKYVKCIKIGKRTHIATTTKQQEDKHRK